MRCSIKSSSHWARAGAGFLSPSSLSFFWSERFRRCWISSLEDCSGIRRSGNSAISTERSVLEPSATVLAINGSQVHWCVTHVLCVYCACSHRIPKQQVEHHGSHKLVLCHVVGSFRIVPCTQDTSLQWLRLQERKTWALKIASVECTRKFQLQNVGKVRGAKLAYQHCGQ